MNENEKRAASGPPFLLFGMLRPSAAVAVILVALMVAAVAAEVEEVEKIL